MAGDLEIGIRAVVVHPSMVAHTIATSTAGLVIARAVHGLR
jgi:hypothetical protein